MCVPNAWRPFSAARQSKRTAQHPFRYWMKWVWHWSTGNVGISTANWLSILEILRIVQFTSFCNSCVRPGSSDTVFWSSMNLRLATVSNVELWNFPWLFHFSETSLTSFTYFQILLQQLSLKKLLISLLNFSRLERDEDLLVEIQQLHPIFVHFFFCRKRLEIRVC